MYKVAIIGCGKIAGLNDDPASKSINTHAKAYRNNSSTDLICAADLNTERLEQFGRIWSIKKLYQDYMDMLHEEEPHIISVCTSNNTHYDILKNIARACRPKIVFCEKPMTLSVSEAEEIVNLYKDGNILFAVNHTRRYEPGHIAIKDFMKRGGIGKIQKVIGYYYKGIVHNGIHMLDYLMDVLGAPVTERILGAAEEPESDFTLDAFVLFEGNVPCYILGFDKQYFDIFEMDFIGTEGRMRIDDFGLTFRYWKRESNPLAGGDIELIEKNPGFKSEYRYAMSYAVQNLVKALDKKEPLKCDGEKALEILRYVLKLKTMALSTFKSNNDIEKLT